MHPLSCRAFKNVNPVGQNSDIKIDVDGSGPLNPFPVTCQYYGNFIMFIIIQINNYNLVKVK